MISMGLVLMLSLVLVVQRQRLGSERARSAVIALAAENAAAERDSTRSIAAKNGRVAALLGDSLGLVEKRVQQVKQRGDALDAALGRERRAAYAMNVVIDSLQSEVAVATINAIDGVQRARFDIREAPYRVAAQVEMPARGDSARLAITVSLDTVTLGARVSCAAANAQGVRAASIVASAPKWAAVRFGRVEQAPEVCQSASAARVGRQRLVFRPLAVGVGRAAVWGGSSGWVLFVGTVITIG